MRPWAFGKLSLLLALCLLVLAGAGSALAEDSVTTFTLPEPRSASGNMSGADMPWLDTALGAVGLPGTAGAADDETTYDRARRMQSGYGDSTRLSYGERYRRNPDGSYGAQSSSQWNRGNVADRLLEQALSAGSGYFSSWAEGWLGGYGNARIQLRINDEGEVTGAGDFLLPIYDSERSTFFTQLGLRTMANDRVIGNFGLGQRFFPAENLAFGYNAFIDQDFSRNHTRGGVGLEAWYDWLRLSANYYTPLSGWKDSEDYDARLVEERPAEGFDARLTGYLPFYRNLAVTGGYEKWKGDHVGSFGNDDVVQKDPKIWSYGLEWTPVPAFAASVNQRHSGGHDETQFGLTFNYHFGMDWEDQLSPAMVAEMRTVDGSRHEFVNRQNEIILAYQAKEGAYNIIQRGSGGANIFLFQITNGFGEPVAGQRVAVSLPSGVTMEPSGLSAGILSSDVNGQIILRLRSVPAAALPVVATLTAGKTSRSFTLGASATGGGLLKFTSEGENSDFNSSAADYQSIIGVAVEYDDGSGTARPITETVSWAVKSVSNPTANWWLRSATAKNGLTWGNAADGTSSWAADAVAGTAPTGGTIQLTDVVGSRSVTLEASVCIGGGGSETTAVACSGNGGVWYTDETTVTFGDGPLSVFGARPGSFPWADTNDITTASSFPAASACGGSVDKNTFPSGAGWTVSSSSYYASDSKLPTEAELQAVAGYNNAYNPNGKGAALAAGWPVAHYWTGVVNFSGDYGQFVNLDDDGYVIGDKFTERHPVVCRP